MSDRRNHQPGFATRAIHHGYDPATAQGALTPPIYMTSTYAFGSTEEGAALFRGEREGYIYGRTKNPTQALLETRLADLEGAEAGLALASGMAAISATLQTLCQAGDRIVADRILYGNTFALLSKGLSRFGITTEFVDFTDAAAVETALSTPAKLVYFETPANPNLRVIDIARISTLARTAGALTVVDNTFATPVLQRPIALGADLVVHSATKYLGGHGDLLAGVVVGPAALVAEIRGHGLRFLTGATISPLTAFLILRGLKTLELRLGQHVRSATAVAQLLQDHPAVARLYYPGLPSHPQHAVAARQMSGGGGLVAFELKGGFEAGVGFMDRVQLAHRAVSLGDAETLVQHPASMTHAAYGAEERARHGIPDGLVRLSIGLETTDDILDDIVAALGR
ncbi:aminotransferase class I/II-fold pyridoxal phosphate-dependent enzyme [Rhodobacter capsulatus]|uniref:Aminotransferase class I/II-fold pyridoxal phosphate-dependent enzyme n=1 Tax=Rhodobacter capsulatus TaxID=1061 RepID=A0A4U1JLN6_RHOCA|nr:aminotransferase class I/II-fold pyridoxal phosphate-dependent enzyme [Rhodobacter capsulatus]TKD14543.1 aminotransferase class I/II-fold pyridoxal phosphate-dependent enzyme [Rhodobacter capsulatus]